MKILLGSYTLAYSRDNDFFESSLLQILIFTGENKLVCLVLSSIFSQA
jgi:hypothetical protein